MPAFIRPMTFSSYEETWIPLDIAMKVFQEESTVFQLPNCSWWAARASERACSSCLVPLHMTQRPAFDPQHLPGDETGRIGSEVDRRATNFLRLR